MTVTELEENLKEGMMAAGGSSKKNLVHAKVAGIACDVCEPADVQKLSNFAVNEFGSIDIWVSSLGLSLANMFLALGFHVFLFYCYFLMVYR